MCLLFTLVTGNCDILECAPVLLIALQCQLLGSKNIWSTETQSHSSDGKTLIFFNGGEQEEWGRGNGEREREFLKCKIS